MSFPVTRSVSKISAVLDGQEDWTMVKKKWKAKIQIEIQSKKLVADGRAKEEPRAPPKQVKTETPSGKHLQTFQRTAPPNLASPI